MKKNIFLLFISILISLTLFAKIITVSNNPSSPGQYKRLDSAIYFAAANDVLLVSGSVTDYAAITGSITIGKPITIYGSGYDPRTDQALATTVSYIHINTGGLGTTISGIYISNQINTDYGTNNITISRCKINNLMNTGSYTNGISGSNYEIRENIIGGEIAIAAYNNSYALSNISIHNNIITGSLGGSPGASNVLIYNNYFTSTNPFSSPAYSGNLYNANVYNNIFYYKSGSSTSSASYTNNCVFNNNLYYNNSNSNPFNIGSNGNIGSNNINANPVFVAIDLTTTSVTRTDNFNLQAGSPGINAGIDGKNIGPEGGSIPIQYPYAGLPAIPWIQSMSISNPVIPTNGTLNVNFKASSNN